MAEVTIRLILQKLNDLLKYNSNLISGEEHQVEYLCHEVQNLQYFLNDSIEKIDEFESAKEFARKIRNVVYETEDIIDTFLVAVLQKPRRFFLFFVSRAKLFRERRLFKARLGMITEKIKSISDRRQRYGLFNIEVDDGRESRYSSTSSKRSTNPIIVEEDSLVGLSEQVKLLVDRLIGGSEELEVISIVGMGGIGKTTLARCIFNDLCIRSHFYIRAWVYVSLEYNARDLFLSILSSVTSSLTEEMYEMSEERLAEQVLEHLTSKRYLIVVDDVWDPEVWSKLSGSFPRHNNGSRIVLTSRNMNVALCAGPVGVWEKSFLALDDSWELLCHKVFLNRSCPPELMELGKRIVERCEGLPLAIVLVAGILSSKEKSYSLWQKVAENVASYISRDRILFLDILQLSYHHLPHQLRACFMYFGNFPEGFEIPVWKLLRLWIAEGFIEQKGLVSLEDIAEQHLEDLVSRSLVLVEKRRANGGIKTCRIHGMLHEFCLARAAEANFLREIRRYEETPPEYYRRLCIRADHVLNYISSKPYCPYVRSFLCFSTEKKSFHLKDTSFIFKAFKLLRVLDISSISLSQFPSEIIHLTNLGYASLLGEFKVVPTSISNLENLQTLIVETTFRSIDIQANIWKMLQFRHLYTNGSSLLHGPSAKTLPLLRRNIQTLSMISPDSCTESILDRTPNLKKLGIRGKLIALVEEKRGSSSMFDNIAKLDHVETLKLLNDTIPVPPFEGKLQGLPRWENFPPNLKKLTLSETMLDWEHMSTLGKLPYLEVLKLKDYAFMGQIWELPLDGKFRLLKVLQLGRTDLVHWGAAGHHFPRLERIVLRHCTSLEEIPSGLGDADTLQIMELYFPTSSAAASARLIQQKSHGNGLTLLIYPPDQ